MIYAIVPFDTGEKILELLDEQALHVYLGEAPNAIFVSYNGTTRELAKVVGLAEGGTNRGIVIPVANYFGFANRELWEWLELNKSEY